MLGEKLPSFEVAGLILSLPHGSASWRVLGHLRNRQEAADRKGRLLVFSRQNPLNIDVVPLSEVEASLKAGTLYASTDCLLGIRAYEQGDVVRAAKQPASFLAEEGLRYPEVTSVLEMV